MSRLERIHHGHLPDFNADLRDAVRCMYYLNARCIDCTLQASADRLQDATGYSMDKFDVVHNGP